MNDQEPKLTQEDDTLGGRFEHPAFGCVTISRVSGGGPLFMSNVRHQHQIHLTVKRASMRRNHNQDNHYAEGEIVEVAMSNVQFAELMAGMNTGSGVPCTLTRVIGTGHIPGIKMENTNRRFSKEAKARFTELATQINTMVKSTQEALEAAKVPKSRQGAILSPMEKLEQDLRSNIPFMQSQFAETMEGIVAEAKSVVESYALERGIAPGEAPILLNKEI